ncbi:MAG: HsdM family class I SAM-dependent methyltransferase [Spirulinaceae cyanobacterium]
MSRSLEINSLESWKLELGLLPVPLFALQNQEDKVILLNGKVGNFCLDLSTESNDEDPRNLAWSSDVGHYVKLLDDIVEVYKWDSKPSSLERYTKKSVENNLERFYTYIQKDQPSRDLSIISFAIKTFRTLRSVLGRDFDGQQSLKAFLCLLACVADDVSRNELDSEKWGLASDNQSSIASVNDSDWKSLVDSLKAGTSFYGLSPNIPLLLRHASGTLFQEAHYEAYTFNQSQLLLPLPGLLPDPVTVKKETNFVGIHYTPPSIARTLVEEALNAVGKLPPTLTVFDPACGSGVFLKEILRQLSLKNYQGRVKIEGWDISPAAIDMARFILWYEKDKFSNQFSIDVEVYHRDSLSQTYEWSNDIDIILMNPPFLSWNNMDKPQRNLVKEFLAELKQKSPDLSSVFLWRAIQSLSPKGVIACILPASILNTQSHSKLREAISTQVDLCLVGKLGNHLLFSNAQIDTAIFVAKRPKNTGLPLSLWADHRLESSSSVLRALRRYNSYGRDLFHVVNEKGFSIYKNPSLAKNTLNWSPRSYESFELLNRLKYFPKVEDIFEIREGVSTGFNSVFILKKKDFEDLPKKEKSFFRPAIITESINEGQLSDLVYVFYPYGEKLPRISSENELQKRVNKYCSEYLIPNKKKLMNRRGKTDGNWWTLSWHRAWQVEKQQRLFSTHFGKAGSFAWDNSGDYAVINGFFWSPRKGKVLPQNVGLAYLAILSCSFINNLLSSISNHVGGGQWDLSKRYIRNMPIPNLMAANIDLNTLDSLCQIGSLIHLGQDFDSKALNQLVLNLYQLPENTILLL